MKNNDNSDNKPEFVKKEEEILKFWQENKIFEKTLEKTKNGKPFVFYDGPPFATGLPHYGHLLAGTIKDAIPRYQTMNGRFVRRRWGWDCHGLPIENLIEEELGLGNKKDIETLGIGNFNEAAKKSVLRYDSDWKVQVPRMGRFIDMESGYRTMDWTYSESIWWAFSELFKKGLIYEGYKSMHICPRCETTLANTEVSQGYKDITDISVTAKFELVDDLNTFILAWTTTPWTLPGNVALAINEELIYVKIKNVNSEVQNDNPKLKNDEYYILAKERLSDVFGDEQYEIVEEFNGTELIGKKYKPVFSYYYNSEIENKENGWKIYSADFVTIESGTGIVHVAPAFGENDMEFGKKYDLPLIQHVGMDGKFKKEVSDFVDMYVKPKDNPQETDIEIIKYLAHKNLLFSKEKIVHSYPHCWRCDTPLLNYASGSWFVKVTKLRDKLVSENKKIKWIPESIGSSRFGNWLEDSRDWTVSRTRFWGAPIPVWKCKKCDEVNVVGSINDIKENVKKSGNGYFVMRHGEADHNVKNIVSSRVDNPHHLTEKGKKDIEKTSERLAGKNITKIFASPFIRTKETVEIVAKELGIDKSNIVFDKRLGEPDMGDFNCKDISEYRSYFSSMKEKFVKNTPNGENLMDLKKRVGEFLYEIDSKYKNENILIITHEYTSWMLFSVSKLADVEQSIKMRSLENDFIDTADFVDMKFMQLPHNEDFEIDLHRPYIDNIKLLCECGENMERIQEVFDCWFESGSMPYAQFHYPFENKKEFERNFPADFIAEGLDQTRGWFYNMLILSVGLFDKSAYKNVIVNGLVLAEDGKKMSKRLKNYPDPMEIVGKYGADAMRYYMLSSPVVRGEDLSFSEKGVDEVYKKVILRLQNVVSFYKLYDSSLKNKTNKRSASSNILDKWILSRLDVLVNEVSESMDAYEIERATRPIALFVDDLSTWYLRRSRDRFKSDNESDKQFALETTRYLLTTLSKVLSPFMPFSAESIYKEVDGGKESVHLEEWPKEKQSIISRIFKTKAPKILKEMGEIRNIVSLGLEERAKIGIKVRQPLSKLKIINNKSEIKWNDGLIKLIKDEVNVKDVVFVEPARSHNEGLDSEKKVELDTELTEDLIKEGTYRELLRHVQSLRKSEKLIPSDIVELFIETDKKGKEIVLEFEEKIKDTAMIRSIDIHDLEEGENIDINNIKFRFKIVK
jgi:isoleucyl-tRNA synthetase